MKRQVEDTEGNTIIKCEGVYTEFDQLYKQIGTDEQIPLDNREQIQL